MYFVVFDIAEIVVKELSQRREGHTAPFDFERILVSGSPDSAKRPKNVLRRRRTRPLQQSTEFASPELLSVEEVRHFSLASTTPKSQLPSQLRVTYSLTHVAGCVCCFSATIVSRPSLVCSESCLSCELLLSRTTVSLVYVRAVLRFFPFCSRLRTHKRRVTREFRLVITKTRTRQIDSECLPQSLEQLILTDNLITTLPAGVGAANA